VTASVRPKVEDPFEKAYHPDLQSTFPVRPTTEKA
jgi:hypothetical protein